MKERIESLEADNKGARERERAAAASKREVESLADSLRERLKLLEERAGVCVLTGLGLVLGLVVGLVMGLVAKVIGLVTWLTDLLA